MGPDGVRGGAEGAVGFWAHGLFSLEEGSALPLPLSSPASLLASLEIGQWCCFSALWDANLHPHDLHC